jgi:SAM-dependent methyltransferase
VTAALRPGTCRLFTPLRERLFRRGLRAALGGCTSLLDVGCGPASPLAATGFRGFAVGTDRAWPDLLAARRRGVHAALVCADAAAIGRVFRPRGVDAVLALDVVEHFEREAALGLLAALERIARRRVVVFTPNGFVPQPPAPDNPLQAHRSGFSAAEMRRLGYRVRGIHGLRWLCGAYGDSRFAPGALWRRVSDLTAPVVYFLPRLAFALLCVKEVEAAGAR